MQSMIGRCAVARELNLEDVGMRKFMVLYMASSADFEKAMKKSTSEHVVRSS